MSLPGTVVIFQARNLILKVIIVSNEFNGLRLVQRHQKVYALASDLMNPGQIHALAIHAYLPSEWQGQAPASPECAHAPKKLRVNFMDAHLLTKLFI